MPDNRTVLSSRAVAVLEMIAAGCGYEQILAAHPDFTYFDIFAGAQEALDAHVCRPHPATCPTFRLAEVRTRHRRAYERWTDGEDCRLREYVRAGETVARIAGRLQRRRSAIRSRIVKLDLVGALSSKEQARLRRQTGAVPIADATENDG